MAKYRIRAAPQDGRPLTETIEVDSMDAAMEYVRRQGLELDAIERIDGSSERFEPETPAPPNAPRPVPKGAVPALAQSFMDLIFGGMFTLIPAIFIVTGIVIMITGPFFFGLIFALFPLLHLSIGIGVLSSVFLGRTRRRRVYANGMAATAVIDRAGKESSFSGGRRNTSNELGWTFYVHGQPYHGKHQTLNKAARLPPEGERIWILYDPEDPSYSVEWPPI